MSRHASPTAQLLRNSRLFSLPQPLPRPIHEQHLRDGIYRQSESATTPYPLRQAIISTSASRSRGDWGLKRPLPKRAASRSSDPVHTVVANDTYESITDYQSAAPHVRTLQKFQELGIAMVRKDEKAKRLGHVAPSALDRQHDVTDRAAVPTRRVNDPPEPLKRWKYGSPGVRSMTPGEFNSWLCDKVKGRADEFATFLRCVLHLTLLVRRFDITHEEVELGQSQMSLTGFHAIQDYKQWIEKLSPQSLVGYLTHPESPAVFTEGDKEKQEERQSSSLSKKHMAQLQERHEVLEKYERECLEAWRTRAWDPDDEAYRTYVSQLREDDRLASKLNELIRTFLDMPPYFIPAAGFLTATEPAQFELTTHATAGLSYLRTNNVINNHSLLGPQRSATPVRARYLRPHSDKMDLGIAGFVGTTNQQLNALQFKFDADAVNKIDRKVKAVYADGRGRIVVQHEKIDDSEAPQVRDGHLEPPLKMQADDWSYVAHAPSRPVPKAEPLDNSTLERLRGMLDEQRGL